MRLGFLGHGSPRCVVIGVSSETTLHFASKLRSTTRMEQSQERCCFSVYPRRGPSQLGSLCGRFTREAGKAVSEAVSAQQKRRGVGHGLLEYLHNRIIHVYIYIYIPFGC